MARVPSSAATTGKGKGKSLATAAVAMRGERRTKKRKRLGYKGIEAIVTGGKRKNLEDGPPIDVITVLTRFTDFKRSIDEALAKVGGDAALTRGYEPSGGLSRSNALAAARVVYATILMVVQQMRENGISKVWILSAQGLQHVMLAIHANLKIVRKLDGGAARCMSHFDLNTLSPGGFGCMRSIVYGVVYNAVRYDLYNNRLKSAFMGYAHASVLTLATLLMRAHRPIDSPLGNLPYVPHRYGKPKLGEHRNRLRIDNNFLRPITNKKESASEYYKPIMNRLGSKLHRSPYERSVRTKSSQTK